MKKRSISMLLCIAMLISMVASHLGMVFHSQEVKAASDKLIVHYGREDNQYDGWNLWLWPEDGEGTECKFTGEDEFGKVAIFDTRTDVEKMGVIVRKNEWESKEGSGDRFIDLKEGVTEVWITSGVEEIATTAPEGAKPFDLAATVEEAAATTTSPSGDTVLLNIHYHRYDKQYDGWNLWIWPEAGEGAAHQFTGEDDFGKVVTVPVEIKDGVTKAGIILRLNEWERKDIDKDRFIDLSSSKDGVIDVYLVEADERIYTNKDDIDLSPKFLSAELLKNTKEIQFKVTVPIASGAEGEINQYKVTDGDGKEYPILKVWPEDDYVGSQVSLIMKETLDLSKNYTITRTDYGTMNVGMGEAFSSPDFEAVYYYDGDDLGSSYSKENTKFRVWAPTASNVQLHLYTEGLGDNLIKTVDMNKDINGTWIWTETGDLQGTYYTYQATVNGIVQGEAVDPYARTTGANGERGMVLDLASTNPANWDKVKKPEFVNMTDAIIYELHVRDLSSDTNSGIKNTGKFLGLIEKGTKSSNGVSTGLDHMVELGITHLHLLPSYDYASVDETKLDTPQFNWGYDPDNYNVPEGSYSTDPYNGAVRVNEFKQMVQGLNESGIRVIMDVVYNHTMTIDSNLNRLVPDYYYRKVGDTFSNASGCGNETASERAMMRKYIVDSVVYWATEYKIDGFRFDLMGIHDIETMNAVRGALDKVDPSIIIYGEGWTSGSSPLPEYLRALKINTEQIDGVAAFSDDIRDGIKGSVFVAEEGGFVSGREGMEESIKFGIVASTNHSQINYELVNYSDKHWAGSPTQTINYASAHDNLALWDKLASSNPEDTVEDRIKMNKLSSAIVLTSQGIPFFQAGEELLRTKVNPDGSFNENSYKSSDEVNMIRWDWKTDNADVFEYYKGLIAFRKAHPALRMTTTEDIQNNLKFIDGVAANVVAYVIENSPNGERAEKIFVVHNANRDSIALDLPTGEWDVYVNHEKAGVEKLSTITDGKLEVAGISSMVLIQGLKDVVETEDTTEDTTEAISDTLTEEKETKGIKWPFIALGLVGAAVLAGGLFFLKGRKKR